MNKYDGCELSAAVMLEDLFISGQNIRKTLTNKADSLNIAVKMTLEGNFVSVSFKNKHNKEVLELIPVSFFRQLTPILK